MAGRRTRTDFPTIMVNLGGVLADEDERNIAAAMDISVTRLRQLIAGTGFPSSRSIAGLMTRYGKFEKVCLLVQDQAQYETAVFDGEQWWAGREYRRRQAEVHKRVPIATESRAEFRAEALADKPDIAPRQVPTSFEMAGAMGYVTAGVAHEDRMIAAFYDDLLEGDTLNLLVYTEDDTAQVTWSVWNGAEQLIIHEPESAEAKAIFDALRVPDVQRKARLYPKPHRWLPTSEDDD